VKLSAQARVLSDAISLASAIKRGGNNPCFAHFETTGDAVSIACTEISLGTIATSVSATIHEPGETAVPIDRLAALLCSLAGDAIVEIEATTRTINVLCGSSRIRLNCPRQSRLKRKLGESRSAARIVSACWSRWRSRTAPDSIWRGALAQRRRSACRGVHRWAQAGSYQCCRLQVLRGP